MSLVGVSNSDTRCRTIMARLFIPLKVMWYNLLSHFPLCIVVNILILKLFSVQFHLIYIKRLSHLLTLSLKGHPWPCSLERWLRITCPSAVSNTYRDFAVFFVFFCLFFVVFLRETHPGNLQNVIGSTQVHARAWNNAQRGTWGHYWKQLRFTVWSL